MSDLVQDMLKAASRYPLLTPLQEVELGRAIRAWQDFPDGPDLAPARVQRAGKRALDRFVVSNIRLAHHIAKRYSDRGVPLEDLMQASIEGMISAYRKFKPELGYRSSSYAIWYARQACQQILATMGQTLRLPVHTCDALGRVAKVARDFCSEYGRQPTPKELAKAAGMSEAQLLQLNELVSRSRMTSIDYTTFGMNSHRALLGRSASDTMTMTPLSPDAAGPSCAVEHLHQLEVANALRSALESNPAISDQQRFILRMLYLESEPINMVRLAYLTNMNRNTLIAMEAEALKLLRSDMADLEPLAVAA